ncbi:MAG: succinylglutamate desuccinylase/aspartoacylase family protein [Myxococcales bacterium]|nr:succinylglutamate desuccinylase/aspartoacylase family protein [Myxococcales bacterium]
MAEQRAADLLRVWDNPRPSEVAHDALSFLRQLGGPTCITIAGERDGPPRVLSTLLHGNEPSGTIALQRFLREGVRPRVPLVAAVLSVEAALSDEPFSHRSRPGGEDLNRCFVAPWAGAEGARARALMERVRMLRPEAVVDLHNTSGRGPAYAVCTRVDARHQALTALFAERIIHTDLRLNTFMEAVEELAPTVTIECGGARDPDAHERAYHGMCRYARAEQVLARPADASPLQVLMHPHRVELAPGARIRYAREPDPEADVTLPPDVDRHNFGVMRTGTPIGWLGARGLSALQVMGAHGREPVELYFRREGDQLFPARDLEPLMATTDEAIASSDCLFYLIPFG